MKSAMQHKIHSITKDGFIKITAITLFLLASEWLLAQALMQYVQPLSGTAPSTTMAALKHSEAGSEKNANTIPAVTLPFAMTQWTPQTRQTERKCVPPYFYKDSMLTGFRASHWLSGSCTQDYGSFTVMPVMGKLKTHASEYAILFSHQDELSTPAYYQLKAGNIITELTATLRCGLMRFTMRQNDSLHLLVMPNSDFEKGFVEVNAKTGEVWGFNPVHRIYQGWGQPAGFSGWFYMKIDKPIAVSGTFNEKQIFNSNRIQDQKDIGVYVSVAMKKDEKLLLRIGTSFTSIEAAKMNYVAEVKGKGFDVIRQQATQQWEKELSHISVSTTNNRDKRIFYTALYHAMQQPRLFSNVDGSYPAFGGNEKLMTMKDGQYYDDFSMWDIYRAQLPLFEILLPSLSNNFVRSLIAKGEQGGWLPIFPCWNSYTAAMIGDHVTAFIASAFNKGIRNYDVEKAYQLMRKNAFETPIDFADYKNGLGRRALTSYLQYGYVPMEDSVQEAYHKKEQVSRTLEYAFDDYALSVVAKGINKTEDFKLLRQRSFNYKNVFDPSVGMMRGRNVDGSWYQPFYADKREPYITEGTSRQYTFYVPQDVAGLSALMGGETKLEEALDSLFLKDEYWHGNEPGHQIPFMYNFTKAPYKTQKRVHQILTDEYGDGPGGLSGNDDAGQMSAWYIFASMGFYPVDPISNNYQLCAPIFDQVVIRTENNRMFKIKRYKTKPDAGFIQKVSWNGNRYNKNFITYEMITQGGQLEIWLTEKPSIWGADKNSRPNELAN